MQAAGHHAEQIITSCIWPAGHLTPVPLGCYELLVTVAKERSKKLKYGPQLSRAGFFF